MQIEHRMDARLGNLIWLSDGRTEAAAALDFGIRIVHLSCAGKPNLFYSQPEDLSDGLKTEEGWRIYGGHRFWASPESSRSYYPDNAPVACELLADGVCLRQRTDPWTGFEKTLILRFAPDGRLSAEHILTNRNPQTVQAAAWGVCTLRGGGTARIPFPAEWPENIRPAASCPSGARRRSRTSGCGSAPRRSARGTCRSGQA